MNKDTGAPCLGAESALHAARIDRKAMKELADTFTRTFMSEQLESVLSMIEEAAERGHRSELIRYHVLPAVEAELRYRGFHVRTIVKDVSDHYKHTVISWGRMLDYYSDNLELYAVLSACRTAASYGEGSIEVIDGLRFPVELMLQRFGFTLTYTPESTYVSWIYYPPTPPYDLAQESYG